MTCHKSSISDAICRGVIFCVQWGEVSAGCSFCWYGWCHCSNFLFTGRGQGRIQDFKLGGAQFKKLRRAEEGANIFGVFCVKNHDFTPKNHIFPILGGGGGGGGARNFGGISCEKSRFYAQKKSYFFQF